MIQRISIFFICSSFLLAAESEEPENKNPISLLPKGSELKGILIPRYDKNRKLVGDLKAETMTIIDDSRIQGNNVKIRFLNPDRSQRGHITLKKAIFDQNNSQLKANEEVHITHDSLVADGTGLIYSFQTGKGFLVGPASTTLTQVKPATSMKTNTLKTSGLVLCLASASPSLAAPPNFLTKEEIAAIHKDAETVSPKVEASNAATQDQLVADTEISNKATEAALSFVRDSNIKTIANEGDFKAPDAPLQVDLNPNTTVISCKGGMYFDAEEGVLVYLKDVTVNDPRFGLSGANELKIFFDKKEPKKDSKKEPKPETDPKKEDKKKKKEDGISIGPNANFGDPSKIVASGAVRFVQKAVDGKEPVEASGAIFTYDIKKGEIIISDGYPWVKQGNYYSRAMKPNLTLRITKKGSFNTEGEWQVGGTNINPDNR